MPHPIIRNRRLRPPASAGAYDPNFPASFSNLTAWWKADSFTLADATPVGAAGVEWLDQSGNGNHLTQVVAASRPLFKTNIVNGKPVVRFAGVDDFLNLTLPIAVLSGAAYTYFIVMANTAAFGASIGPSGPEHDFSGTNAAAFGSTGTRQSTAFGVASASYKLVILKRDGATSVAFRENTTARGGGASIGDIVASTIGQRSGTSFLVGSIAEIAIYTATRTDAECDQFYTSYFQPKYAI